MDTAGNLVYAYILLYDLQHPVFHFMQRQELIPTITPKDPTWHGAVAGKC